MIAVLRLNDIHVTVFAGGIERPIFKILRRAAGGYALVGAAVKAALTGRGGGGIITVFLGKERKRKFCFCLLYTSGAADARVGADER